MASYFKGGGRVVIGFVVVVMVGFGVLGGMLGLGMLRNIKNNIVS